ncbi:TPA: GIY-YIG nuclease family protein [Bacillus cereus]|uniref:GIY-YIG nuclease family protein n=1 Tax=Bacillus TaxID=1386 RepID=UPI001C30470B|nr:MULTISPECIES: GIY-YIG nuclease family protein [unclassified Bacillus (in: firmicutes)]MCP1284011.1 GIY-YIG nuclease family protein [Bacillus sp. S0635]MCQ6348255.1 GIY-YIG nuclease family protein [Bacillus cereus]HDX9630885.1 GIY-YIG nuclease family protein [Bacillus cereus]
MNNNKGLKLKELLSSLSDAQLKYLAKKYRSKRYKKKKFEKTSGWIDSIYNVMSNEHNNSEEIMYAQIKKVQSAIVPKDDFKAIDKLIKEIETSPTRKRTLAFHENANAKFVYLIIEKLYGAIKIGSTKKLDQRLMQFGVKLPFDIKIVHIIYSENGDITEKLLHKYFSSKRLNGEWFSLNKKDLSDVKNLNLPKKILKSINGMYHETGS